MVKKQHHHDCDCETQDASVSLPHEKTPGTLDAILSNITVSQHALPESADRINGIVVGRIVRCDAASAPMVDFTANVASVPVQALSTVPVDPKDKGREVALAFVNGDPGKPVILGFMHVPAASVENRLTAEHSSRAINVEKDGETVTISAEKQIVLRCGESSITLTKAGKVLINGAYVSSRAKGVNRVFGGSVLLN